jgi:hypothetical protein
MTKRVEIKEWSYGVIVLEDVPEDASDEEILKMAQEKYYEGNTCWNGGDFELGKIYDD